MKVDTPTPHDRPESSMPCVRLDRIILAAAGRTEALIQKCKRGGGLTLCVTKGTELSYTISASAENAIAQALDVVVIINGERELAYPKCALILTPDTDGYLSGDMEVQTSTPHPYWTCEPPKSLSDIDGSLAPIISASVQQNNCGAWVRAARTLPKGHALRAAVREALKR